MPNVAGREFPYTPEGLQAAERYRQALGMRNGGLLGFRPLGYAHGGVADVTEAAPPGHFPAYITPDEAEMLRARGGGVAPDGGQLMANGIPTFEDGDADGEGEGEGTGGSGQGSAGDSGGEDSEGAPSAGTGGGGGTGDSGGGGGWSPGVAAEEAAQEAAEAEAQAAVDSAVSMVEFDEAHDTQMGLTSYSGQPGLDSGALAQRAARSYVARSFPHTANLSQTAMPAPFSAMTVSQAIAEPVDTNPAAQGRYSMAGGWVSNAEKSEEATVQDFLDISAQDPTGQSVLNVPAPANTVALSRATAAIADLNPTATNAMFGIAGFMPGFIGPMSTGIGALTSRGFLNMAQDWDIPGARALAEVGRSVAAEVGNLTSPLSQALSNIGTSAMEQGRAAVDYGTSLVDDLGLGDTFGSSSDNDSVEGEADSVDGDAPTPAYVAPEVPDPDPVVGAPNPFFAANAGDYTVASSNLGPGKYIPAYAPVPWSPPTYSEDNNWGFSPPPAGSINTQAIVPWYNKLTGQTTQTSYGGFNNPDPNWIRGQLPDNWTQPTPVETSFMKDGGMIGFRPLGYANGGMIRGYDEGGEAVAVNRQTVQDFMEQLRSAPVESLNDYMYRNLDALKMAAQDPAFAEQLGDVMARTGFEEHMRLLMADSPPAPGLGGPVSEQMPLPQMQQMMPPPQMQQMMPPIPQMRPPPPQMPPPQMPMGPNVQGMNRGGIMSLRQM